MLETAEELADGPLAGLALRVLHGRLPADEKDDTMRGFAHGQVDVLVATTVVEVGVDVPNATIMVILDADRFGVSQLHQLRGRVGRGAKPGLCLLVTDSPAASPARARLDAVASTLDGFQLSRLDLEQRREGNVLGAAQAGRKSSLKMLTLLADEELIGQARPGGHCAGRRRPGAGQPSGAGHRDQRAARRGTSRVPGESMTVFALRSASLRLRGAWTRLLPSSLVARSSLRPAHLPIPPSLSSRRRPPSARVSPVGGAPPLARGAFGAKPFGSS